MSIHNPSDGRGMHNAKLSAADIIEAVTLYTTPLPDGTWLGVPSIARSLGVTVPTIMHHLHAAGVSIHTAKEARAGKQCRPVKNLPVGDPPFCKCSCGQLVAWNQRSNKWNLYVEGHYRPDRPYKHRDWLWRRYVIEIATIEEIAAECGVGATAVHKYMNKFKIPVRPHGETLIIRGSVSRHRNPAWKGGCAKWLYAPEWKRIARMVRWRDDYTCQLCLLRFPKRSRALQVHHIDSNRRNNDGLNLICLCQSCHPHGRQQEHAAAAHLRSLTAVKPPLINYTTLQYRLTHGLTMEEALQKPSCFTSRPVPQVDLPENWG